MVNWRISFGLLNCGLDRAPNAATPELRF